jgi:hypothetical protein
MNFFKVKMMFAKKRIFQKVFIGVMLAFMGLMGIVTFVAFSRSSGFTRQDMAEAQFIRQNALLEKHMSSSLQADTSSSLK